VCDVLALPYKILSIFYFAIKGVVGKIYCAILWAIKGGWEGGGIAQEYAINSIMPLFHVEKGFFFDTPLNPPIPIRNPTPKKQINTSPNSLKRP